MRKLILKLIQWYFLRIDSKFRRDDLIYYGDNDYQYELTGVYYSFDLQPFAFIRDPADGRIFGVPLRLCRSPYSR